MCGIALLFDIDKRTPEEAALRRMNRALSHRGPDDSDVYLHGPVGFGHTRLSIVDVRGGHQPMHAADGALTIVFNGEIYNYRALRQQLQGRGVVFHTESDTEVILHLYRAHGAACVNELRGMFSFAIYERDSERLFIARDRLGIKPLFYHWNGRQLIAASEMKALFASGHVTPRFEPQSIKNYFVYQHAVAPYTPFAGVLELPPGHTLTIAPGGAPHLQQYWDLHFPRDGDYETLDEEYWTQQFAQGLEDAAATHTIGEVPIGAYLSGGIDSSTTAWLLTKHYAQRLRTFSIHFLTEDMDESPMYRATAKQLGVENVELVMDDRRPQGFLNELADCVYHLEQPQRLAVDIPHFQLSDLVRRNNYKVVYTGDGADEIFGGYDVYRQDAMRVWGNAMRNPRQRRAKYLQEYTQWFSTHYVRTLMRLHRPRNQRKVFRQFGCYPAWYDFWQILAECLPGLFSEDFAQATRHDWQMEEAAAAMRPHVAGLHPLNQSLYIETKSRLPGWILWKSDRLSMAHSVEARVPFMDHPLVELAARVPPDLKLRGMDEKYLLRKIAMPHLPQHPTAYKKRAFYTPIREWFFTRDRLAELEPYLSTAALRDTAIFNPAKVRHLLKRLVESPAPTDRDAYYRSMQLEWVLTAVLTTQMLHAQYVHKQGACFAG